MCILLAGDVIGGTVFWWLVEMFFLDVWEVECWGVVGGAFSGNGWLVGGAVTIDCWGARFRGRCLVRVFLV